MQIDILFGRHSAARKRQKIVNNAVRPVQLLHDNLKIRFHAGRTLLIHELQKAPHYSHRIPDFMGNSGRHLSDERKTLDMA
ncbi:hypothetical protein D3C73_1428680 [compost metagenome]